LPLVALYTGWPKKVSHYQVIRKFYLLKSANEFKFLRYIKEMIKYHKLSVGIKYCLRDLLFDINNYARPTKS